jgi:DNA-binding MarR family transcriptional regulator
MQKSTYKGIAFIHADLDLYGLNPYQFRIYCHIARRGQCYSSLKTIANICKMSVRKTQYCLKELEELDLISKVIREGKTDIYELTDRSEWVESKESTEIKLDVADFIMHNF